MTRTQATGPNARTDRWAIPTLSWLPLALIAALTLASALFVAVTPAGGQTELAERTWEQFAAGDPEVASRFSMQLVLVGVSAAAFSLLSLAVVLIPYRAGHRWAWRILWLMPITHGLISARMLVDGYPVGYYYAALALGAAVALVIPTRPTERATAPRC